MCQEVEPPHLGIQDPSRLPRTASPAIFNKMVSAVRSTLFWRSPLVVSLVTVGGLLDHLIDGISALRGVFFILSLPLFNNFDG